MTPSDTCAAALSAEDVASVRHVDRAAVAEQIRCLSILRPMRTMCDIAANWLIIAAAVGTAMWIGQWPAYIVAGIIVATRQHALGVIMHEGTHYRIHNRRDGTP